VLARNGETFSFDRELSTRVWDRARDPSLAKTVLDESLALLGLPNEPAAWISRAAPA
jgi:hypothetical protein